MDESRARPFYDPELSALVESLNGGGSRDRSEPSFLAAIPEATAPPQALIDLLADAVRRGASDVLLVAGSEPVLRIDGGLVRYGGDLLTGPVIRNLVLPVIDHRRRDELERRRFADFGFDVQRVGRFRANVHFERGRLGACFRVLPEGVPRMEELGLPVSVRRLADLRGGLILVVGPAGSGKTTTLAALLERIIRVRGVHAITIEEPIEYLHEHHDSLVEQVEIPSDCPEFSEALRSALRQSPDVLLVGEMRDSATMSTALTAAETGHLVLASVHAYTAPQAVHRLLDAFPSTQQEQIQRQLGLSMAAIVAQRLVPAAKGGRRVVAVEVLLANDAVRNLIRDGRVHQLAQAIAAGRAHGMMTLEASLATLVKEGRIEREVAEGYAFHPDELAQMLR